MSLWSSTPAPPTPPSSPPPSTSANNALFLIGASACLAFPHAPLSNCNFIMYAGLGMFLVVSVLPALMVALVKLALLAVAALLLAAATNPSDRSFAEWVSGQELLRAKEEAAPSVARWVSAAVRSAIAIVRNEPLVWRVHNAVFFTIVFVPTVERYAIGGFGAWRWADSNQFLTYLCKAPWVATISRGGFDSGLDRYQNNGGGGGAFPRSGRATDFADDNSKDSSVRRRHHAGAAPSSASSSPFADVLEATGLSGVTSARAPTSADVSDRELRTRAMQLKIRQEWKDAARTFLDAASVALSTLAKTNYRLEAAWCILEDSDKYPNKKTQLIKLVEEVCEVQYRPYPRGACRRRMRAGIAAYEVELTDERVWSVALPGAVVGRVL